MKLLLRWLLVFLWALIIWRLTTIPDFHPSSDSVISALLSNGGHFIFFGIQAILLRLAILNLRNSSFYPLTLTSLYGLTIEIVQLNIHGRSFSVFDWALDSLGALTFLFLIHKLQSKS